MLRKIALAFVFTLVGSTSASAETWYVISATPQGALIMDTDSRKSDQNSFITLRLVHPGAREYRGVPLIATQFRLEIDCKGKQFRTVDFAEIDVDGRIPTDLDSNKVRDWKDGPVSAARQFACDGQLPTKITGPMSFTDIESKYLMWLEYGSGKDFDQYVLQKYFP
jgi:hypothetical protein